MPTASCPFETLNSPGAIFPRPAFASPPTAPVNAPINGATALTILKPLYATNSFGSATATFAIASECFSRNPETATIPSLTLPKVVEKFSILSVLPKEPESFLISPMIAPAASPSAVPASTASVLKIFQYGFVFSTIDSILSTAFSIPFPLASFSSIFPTISVAMPTKPLIFPPTWLNAVIPSPSIADCSFTTSCCKLSIFISAISLAAPSLL